MEIMYTIAELGIIKEHLNIRINKLDGEIQMAAIVGKMDNVRQLTVQQLEIHSVIDKTNLIIEKKSFNR